MDIGSKIRCLAIGHRSQQEHGAARQPIYDHHSELWYGADFYPSATLKPGASGWWPSYSWAWDHRYDVLLSVIVVYRSQEHRDRRHLIGGHHSEL